jgi:sensor histidine kinase regulating citrate/malate metabolism
MSNEVKSNIFNFGFSTKGNEKTRGYGLHSCLDTVEKYGGKINVESEVGKGTTFFVYLPIKNEA